MINDSFDMNLLQINRKSVEVCDAFSGSEEEIIETISSDNSFECIFEKETEKLEKNDTNDGNRQNLFFGKLST